MAKRDTDIHAAKELVAVPLEFSIPENHITPFASHLVVQAEEDVIRISFFQANPPIILNSTEKQAPEKIKAELVTSVYLTPNKADKLVAILQMHLVKYRAKKKRSTDQN